MASTAITVVHQSIERHPFAGFVALAYALSWTLWAIAAMGGGTVPFLIGGLGPMAAAGIVTRLTGGSLRAWLRPVWHWNVQARWWIYALGLPVLLYGAVNAVLQLTGSPVDWGLIVQRLPSYAGTFAFVLVLGGGLEEPGWRGFGLPLLQARHSAVRSTLLLGLVWGVWHIPLYGPAGFVVPMVLAFFYTVLWNRTQSVLLCVLLHASFTPAQEQLVLMAKDRAYSAALDAPDWAILGTYVVVVLILVALTKGRLGKNVAVPSDVPPSRRIGVSTVS